VRRIVTHNLRWTQLSSLETGPPGVQDLRVYKSFDRQEGAVTPRRILIIDDNVSFAENISEILQIQGHVTEIAASGEEALAKALADRSDVVITDYRLPGIDGASLLRRLQAMGVPIHAIVISAYTDERTIADARNAGAMFVSKPIDFEVLGRAIRGREGSA
jgi:CheY-like chemotaxis protein